MHSNEYTLLNAQEMLNAQLPHILMGPCQQAAACSVLSYTVYIGDVARLEGSPREDIHLLFIVCLHIIKCSFFIMTFMVTNLS